MGQLPGVGSWELNCSLWCAFWLAGSLVRLSKVRQTIINIECLSPMQAVLRFLARWFTTRPEK